MMMNSSGAFNTSTLPLQTMLYNIGSKNISINFPEKIVFVIDTVQEPSGTQFQLNTGQRYKILNVLKRIIEIFLHNKLMMNQKHEFALVILDFQNVKWLCNFTNDIKTLLTTLESIEECTISNDKQYCNLHQIFDVIHQRVFREKSFLNNVVRLILLYCRSNSIPRFNITDNVVQELIGNPNFFLDILYIHEIPSSRNKCEEIYSELSKLDIKNVSYIMEASRNAAKVHNFMARLLAHPTQRVIQKDIQYCINPTITHLNPEVKLDN